MTIADGRARLQGSKWHQRIPRASMALIAAAHNAISIEDTANLLYMGSSNGLAFSEAVVLAVCEPQATSPREQNGSVLP